MRFRARIGRAESTDFLSSIDLANVPCARQLWDKELRGELTVTPPMKTRVGGKDVVRSILAEAARVLLASRTG